MHPSHLRAISFVLLAVALTTACPAAAENVYPDPGFEGTGEPGVARTGEKAGHLSVTARSHWDAIGTRVEVEPFARYRVTEWVKADVTAGAFFAPYCYEWDSYEWAFVSSRPIATCREWTRTEITFVSPHKTMYVHPLAYMDAENGQAWVDDVVVEKIAGPEQAMAEIAASPNPSETEQRLLARWYVARGRTADAVALLQRCDGLTRADVATVLALQSTGPAERRRFVVEAIAFGGPSYNEGVKRFQEMTPGVSSAERLALCAEALQRNPSLDRAGRGVRMVVEDTLRASGGPATAGAVRERLGGVRESLAAALAAIPADSPAAKEVQIAMKSVDEATASLEARRRELGHCTVRIGGRAITPATHAIVVPDAPTPQESYAARELQYHLELITGAAVPIRGEKEAGGATPLYVGRCRSVKPAALRVRQDRLGLEGLHVRTAGPALMLAGNQRGVLYAVYTFLEDSLGCRWFTPDCATWPKEGTLDVPALDRRVLPALEYRAGDYPVARNGELAARLRLNGAGHAQSEEQGGRVGVRSLAHTFAALVPPEKYFQEHPEYFSLVKEERQSGYSQLCLTNPEVLRITIEGVRRWIRENPSQTVFSVSQNDTAGYCECPQCAAVAREEGSQAGPMLRFVNAVADDIGREYPNVAIETLAYQYTRKPPKITRPRPNVIVCLCSIECCFIHPLGDDAFNKSFVDDIKGWSRICNCLWIWDYIINYAHSICPFPNLYVMKPNVGFFLKNGVKGIYEESCYYTKGSELQELRNYVMAKTLWDPACDTDKAIDEFCAAYYGPAGPFVRRYVTLIHQATQRDPGLHVRIYTHPKDYVTPEMIAEARGLFDQAEAAVQADPVRLHRVQVARLPILYAEITLARGGAWVEQDDRLAQAGATDVSGLAEQFERIARAEGVTQVREGGPTTTLDAWLQSIPRRPREIPVERLRSGALQADVLPSLGGRIWRLRLLEGTRDLLAMSGSPAGWNPLEAGYEEYSEAGYRAAGWQEAYTVKERSERGITLEAALPNGLRLTRRIELEDTKPVLHVTSTVANPGGAPRTACLRVHPEFRVTSTQQASVHIRRADGTWRVVPLANPADPNAEKDEWLREGEVPAGAWAVVDEATGIALVNRVPREQIGQCLLNWSGAQKRVNLEVFSPERALGPGESLTLAQSYEVTTPAAVR